MDYEKLCDFAKQADSKVRFAGVINSRGRLIAGGMVSTKKRLGDRKRDEMLYMELALRVKMRSEFDDDLGKVKFSMSFREKLIVMSFPMKNNILMVSMVLLYQYLFGVGEIQDFQVLVDNLYPATKIPLNSENKFILDKKLVGHNQQHH